VTLIEEVIDFNKPHALLTIEDMNNQIRSLEIQQADLNACNVKNLVRPFAKIEASGDTRLKHLRGTVIISFPSLDPDPRPNYFMPEVRRFIEQIYRELPHFLYYLTPEPLLGAVGMHVLSLLPNSELTIRDNAAMPKDHACLARLMAERLKRAVAFARHIGDDAEALVDSYLCLCAGRALDDRSRPRLGVTPTQPPFLKSDAPRPVHQLLAAR
jgi:hypothetical protein